MREGDRSAGLPSVAEMMAPYAAELEPSALTTLVPQGRVTLRLRDVNWKTVADNYADGLHIPVIGRAHLILNKRTVGRPQDLLDADLLESSG